MDESDLIRASDQDRDAAVERLQNAVAEGRLTLEELTSRTEAAYAAKTGGELAKITRDLPERPASRSAPPAKSARRRRIVSVFGDVTRSGAWRADERITPISVFGDVDLDLRQASVPAGLAWIDAITPFGNVEVIVPPGVEVDVGGFTLFGSKKIAVPPPPVRSRPAPVIRIRAFTLFGSVKVWSP
jgi:hypothetical protein